MKIIYYVFFVVKITFVCVCVYIPTCYCAFSLLVLVRHPDLRDEFVITNNIQDCIRMPERLFKFAHTLE